MGANWICSFNLRTMLLSYIWSQVPEFPSKLFFFCEVEPGSGGETPIVLSHVVYERMKEKIGREWILRKALSVCLRSQNSFFFLLLLMLCTTVHLYVLFSSTPIILKSMLPYCFLLYISLQLPFCLRDIFEIAKLVQGQFFFFFFFHEFRSFSSIVYSP